MKTGLLGVVLLAFFCSLFVATSASAAGGYGGFQYATATYEEDGFSGDWSPTALIFRGGTKLNDNFGLEARVGFGMSDDSQNISGFELNLELDSLYGVYCLGHLPIAETSSVYGLLGFTQGELTASIAGIGSVSDDDSGLSLGIGTNIGLNETIALNLEYVQYMSKSDFDISALSLGMVFNF